MRPTLGGFSYVYNAVEFDIPFMESIRSVIDVVDEFVLCECYSTDDTWDWCQHLQKEYPDKLKLVRHEWVKHFTQISTLANWTMEHLTTDYCMQLQSDECVHEKDLDELRNLPLKMQENDKPAARWKYLHFIGNPHTTFPFCYSELVRIVKNKTPWHVTGDGVQFVFAPGYIPETRVLNTNIEVFHYGKMKDPTKGYRKEVSFQNLFTDIGFPDPKMKVMLDNIGENCDYVFLFEDHVKNGTISEFKGTHPKVMEKCLLEFKDQGFEQFVSRIKQELKINFNKDK